MAGAAVGFGHGLWDSRAAEVHVQVLLTIILDYGFSHKFVFDFFLVFDMAVTLADIVSSLVKTGDEMRVAAERIGPGDGP